ncbi:dipicolinate synthase subunit B [Actinobacillus pleuropneumoniae]|nr:dipicolinate synthase subunit B [Actinobacillus pleuropneumoniae]
MNWNGITVGYALTGSHCTLEEVMPQIQRFKDGGANVVPIVSSTNHDDRYPIRHIGKLAETVERYNRE